MTISEIKENIKSNLLGAVSEESNYLFLEMLIPSAAKSVQENQICSSSLTFHDFKKECHEQLLSDLEIVKTNEVFQDFLELAYFVKYKHAVTQQEKEEFLQCKNYANFVKHLQDEASRIVKVALEQFQKGAPISVILEPDKSSLKINNFPAESMREAQKKGHPKTLEKMRRTTMSYAPFYNPREEKKFEMRVTLMSKRLQKSHENRELANIKRCNEYSDLLHYLLFLSSKLNKDLEQVLDAELASQVNQKAYEDFKEKKRMRLDRKRELEIEQSFQTSLPEKPTKRKGKKKKKQLSSVSKEKGVLEKTVAPLTKGEETFALPTLIIPQKSDFSLDKRITRWFHATSDGIKKFTDKDMLKTVHRYQDCNPEQLEEQRIYHCLAGVARLMSLSPENLQKYSTPYQFMHNGILKRGRCFSAQLKYGDSQEEGMIYVGVDGKRIYHAKFVPFRKIELTSECKPKDLCLPLDGLDSQPNPQEGEWEMEGVYAFAIIDEIIVWSIANEHSPVEYQIQPLF